MSFDRKRSERTYRRAMRDMDRNRDPLRMELDRVLVLDQTLLPEREEWVEVRDAHEMARAIAKLQVRGAPAIGIAAAMALVMEARHDGSVRERLARMQKAADMLRGVRPTAVNLVRSLDHVLAWARGLVYPEIDPEEFVRMVGCGVMDMWRDDREASQGMAEHGASLFPSERRFLTHCNTGSLATGGGGTALGVLFELHATSPGTIEVWATETRPLLQGARLTAWELQREGIPFRLIVDSAASHVILHHGIEAVVVGADRIATNGDTANKIGTLALALAAREAGIPFVVVAPSTTLDSTLGNGSGIVIEERDPSEVTSIRGVRVAPEGVEALNPAFDVTPARLIHAIVTERGVFRGPHYYLGSSFDTKPGPC